MRDFARRVSAVAAIVTALGGALAAACGSAYSDGDAPAAGGDPDGGTSDSTLGSDAAVPDPCVHAGPPAAPAKSDSADELPTFFMAIQTLNLSAPSGTETQGFDLDGICSCDTRSGSAFAGAPACKAPGSTPSCDLDGGIDNAASQLTAALSPFYSLDSIAQHLITSGRRTLLIQIGKYNGQLDDTEVAVGLAMSDGVRTQGCPTSEENVSKGIWSPGWCGDDAWTLVDGAVIPGTSQPYLQTIGYVTNGELVIRVPSTSTVPFNEAQSLTIASSLLKGTLVPLGDDLQPRPRDQAPTSDRQKRLWALTNATYAGRVTALSLLGALGTISVQHDGGPSTYFCDESLFPTLRTAVCGGRDIPSMTDHDHDLGTTCDALSLAMSVTAFPVLAGEVRTPNPSTTACTPSATGEVDGGRPYDCP